MKAMLFDADYFMNGQQPVVRMFCKTESGDTVCVYNSKMHPYFYFKTKIPEESVLSSITGALSKHKLTVSIKSLETVYKYSPLGFMKDKEKLIKITLHNPQDVPKLRDVLLSDGIVDSVYEADIMYKYRFMVDNDLHGMQWMELQPERIRTTTSRFPVYNSEKIVPLDEQKSAPLRYMALDIECSSLDQGRMPDANLDPIIMVSIAFDPPFKGKNTLVLVAKRTQTENVSWFPSEKEMLEEFVAITQAYDPDVITGYNINGFDMPWLIKRAQKNDVKFDVARSEKQVSMKKGLYPEYIVPGRVVIDPFQILKRDPWQKFARYDLNTVSKVLLNDEKHNIEYGEISTLWNGSKDDVNRLIEYARKDVVLAMRLVKEKGMLDKFIEISKISGLLMQDTFGGQTKRIETMMLYEFRKRDFVMPFAKRKDNSGQSLKGAMVLEPQKGLHHGNCTVVLDFRSLYPSIMRTFNISPDTLILNGEDNGLECNTSPSGAKFVTQEIREGIFPNILAKLMQARADAKTAMKAADGDLKKTLNARQLALKDLSNSMYGFTGYARARLYVLDVAASITAYGRENIEKTTRLIKEKYPGFEVVYGDSITKDRFVTLSNPEGMIEIKNIEELFEQNIKKVIITSDGKERILLSGYTALTIDPLTKQTEWQKIREIIRHKTNKKIYRVNQKFGETRVTEDHSLITENNGKLKETKPNQLGNKKLERVDSIPETSQISKIDMYELLKNYEYRQIYKNRIKVAKFHRDENFIWFGWENRQNPVKLKRFIKIDSLEFDALCKLIGAYIAEGSSSTLETTSRYGASIACSDIVWLQELQSAYELLFENTESCIIQSSFGIRELVYADKKLLYEDKTYKLQMMNSLAVVVFKVLCGQKSYGKKIPNFMFHVPMEKQEIMLTNMLKGDGFIEKSARYSDMYKSKNFRYDTKSLNLACCLSLLLTMHGKKHTIKLRKDKNVYRITTCSKYNKNLRTDVSEEIYDGYVYDLSVDKNHMFVDACGQILLHNTDSVFIKVPTDRLDQAKQYGEEVASYISNQLPGHLELVFEKIYKTFLILAKKRYAGWRFDYSEDTDAFGVKTGKWVDKIDMKGIETVRRDWCLTGDTLIQLADGTLKPIKDVPEKCEVLTINPKTLKIQKDKSIAKSKRESLVYKITTDFIEVKATPEHKFFTYNDGKFRFKKASNLKKGDNLIQARIIDFEGVPQKIDFEYKNYFRKDIKIPMVTSKDLCQIIGFVFGDGSVAKKKVTLYNKDLKLLEHYNNLFAKVFGISGKLYKGNGCYNLVFFSKKLEMFFRKFGFNNRISIPEIIHKLPKEQLATFLRGYFDADGGVSINNKTASKNKSYIAIDFAANSRRVAEEVKILLLRFGIWSSNLRFHKSIGTTYEFRLNCENARRFIDLIGFTIKNIDTTRPYMLKGKTERLPLIEEAKFLISKTGYAPTKFLRGYGQTTITKSTARSILGFAAKNIEDADDDFLESYCLMNQILESDIAFTKIEKIEEIGIETVYDMDTIETDTFLANGLVSHNCPLVSEVMVDVLSIMLKENNVKKAIENTKTIITNIRNNQVPLEKLTVIKGITRSIGDYKATLPHIELAKKMKVRDPANAPNVGDRLGFVIIKGNQLISKRAEDPKYVIDNKLQIDSDYYIQSQLLPPIERIFMSVGVDRSELFGAGRQLTLGALAKKSVANNNVLNGMEEFVCNTCAHSYRRMPLRGLCECGGSIMLAYQGSVGNVVRTE